ncbi:MAG: hypothetical protein IPM94_01245 [bacterium]|nr:hypothetical protein [bacterium]
MKPSLVWQARQEAPPNSSTNSSCVRPLAVPWPEVTHSSSCPSWQGTQEAVISPSTIVEKTTFGVWALKSGPIGPWQDSHWTFSSASRREAASVVSTPK